MNTATVYFQSHLPPLLYAVELAKASNEYQYADIEAHTQSPSSRG